MRKRSWIQKNRWLVVWAVLSIMVALVIHCLFRTPAPFDFLEARWTAGEILTYISTVSLGLLAMWQNKKSGEENDKILRQQMRQNIGYFELERSEQKIPFYRDLQIGQCHTLNGQLDSSRNNTLVISLKNVGQDIIIAPHILESHVNGKEYNLSISINMVYKEESIKFEISPLPTQPPTEELNISLTLGMQNLASVKYFENIEISARHIGSCTYRIYGFNPKLYFEEDK